MNDLILFDLDGTLTDPAEGITNSVRYALAKHGITVNDSSVLHPFIGPPLIDSFMRFYGFSKSEAVRAVDEYREYYATRGIWENKIYDGIPELLSALRNAGKTVCMATSKPEVFARQIAAHFHIDGYFHFIAGSLMDETRTKKADVITYALQSLGRTIPDGAVMIGDRSYDVLGAREVGMGCIGVTYGYGSAEELTTAGADALADSPEALRKLLLG